MNRWQVCRLLALVMVTGLAGASCDDNRPRVPDDGMGDAGIPDGPSGPTGGLRFMHAAPAAGDLDIYLHDQTTPLFSGIRYGTTSAPSRLPPGTYQLDLRRGGKPTTESPIFTSEPITVAVDSSITAVGMGAITTDPLLPPTAAMIFRVATLPDAFAPVAPGKTRVRVVNTMYSLNTPIAVDVGGDGTLEIASLDRFAASDAAGLEVTAGSELAFQIQTADNLHTRVGSFVVPATSLGDGADVYVFVNGLTTFPPRDVRGPVAVVAPMPGTGQTVAVRPNPVIYLVAASPDANGIDGYVGPSKLFANLTFGRLGSATVRSTTTGDTIDIRTVGSAPTTAPLVSLSTGALEAGQQYLAVLTGLVNPTSNADALKLLVYRDDIQTTNDFGRVRVVNASVGAGTIDAGRYATDGWVDVTDFMAIPPGGASHPFGTAVLPISTAPPLFLGARLSANQPWRCVSTSSPDCPRLIGSTACSPVRGHRSAIRLRLASSWSRPQRSTPVPSPYRRRYPRRSR